MSEREDKVNNYYSPFAKLRHNWLVILSLIIFGRDVSKIPCFRNSLLYGIGGGLFCGLFRFMFTSHTLKSVNFSVYSFSFITLGYWIQCRYNYSKTKFEMMRLQEMLQNHAILEGTQEAEIIEKELGTRPVDV
uniref:Cytochrome c oxidase assembly protein COX20, mitochondrial n=1 Tax=Diabrotica virgifera virgifera TaxID=50390 RepID=A0A6P7GMF5_DIAVI